MKQAGLICLLLLTFSGWSQTPVSGVSPLQGNQLRFEKYDFRQGLSNPVISSIYQDKAGFLWVGTPFGLNRYDGSRFENYFHEPGQPNSLVHNTIFSITEDRDHLLWIGTMEGISCFNPRINHFINYHPAGKGIRRLDKRRCTVYADEDNNLWIGSESGIVVLNAARTAVKEIPADLNSSDTSVKGSVNGFTEDKEYLWAATANGLFRVHKKTFIAEHTGDKTNAIYHSELLRISKDAKGRIWSCNWRGQVLWWDPADKQAHYRTMDNVSIMDVVSTVENGREYIYISTVKGLIKMETNDFFKSKPFTYHLPDPDDPFSINHRVTSDIFQDRDRNIWIGSEAGLNKLDPSGLYFSVFSYAHFNTDFAMYAMCSTDIPDEYYVLAGSHVFRMSREKGIIRSVFFGKQYECYDLYRTGNTYWMTINGGLLRLDRELNVIAHYKLPFRQVSYENRFRWIMENSDGSLWISTARTGIVRVDTNKNTLQRLFHDTASALNLTGNYVEEMIRDHDDRVWIGTSGGLFLYDQEKDAIRKISLCGVTNHVKDCENVKGLYEHKGKMYICTQAGLYAYDLRTDSIHYLPIHGQGISKVTNHLVADARDRLWINTNNGLVVYDPASAKTFLYGQKNGLPYQDLWSPIYRFGNDIFTSASSSVVCFHTDKIKQESTAPPPVFSSVIVNDTSFVESSSKTVLSWNGSIAFNFISLQYNNSASTQYVYLLEGLDKIWHPISFNNSLRFSNLPAGNYSLQVKAINSDGAESAPALFSFSVRPPLWKTWWFISLLILAVSMAVYALYRYRIRQAVRLERMRMRIATDLHDDIGATLSSISMYSDAVKKQVGITLPHLEPVLDKMGENSRSMVSSMSDIVWALNPDNDEGEKLLERIENYGKDTCSVQNIRFVFHADKRIHTLSLPPEQRKNIYLIFKEAINNSLKYARATEITVNIYGAGKMLSMTIADNGKGFDESKVKKGNGLENMRQRAREIGLLLVISSGQTGTCVHVKEKE